jgi:hypothetical protein
MKERTLLLLLNFHIIAAINLKNELIYCPIRMNKRGFMNFKEELKKAYRMNVIINAAFIVVLLSYALIVEVLRSRIKPFHGFRLIPNAQALRLVFYGLGIVQIILVRFLQPALYKQTPEDNPKRLLQKLNRANLVTLSLCEIPALLGLLLFLLIGLYKDFYIFLIISLILEFMYFPKLRHWEEWLKSNPQVCDLQGGKE